MDDDAITLRDQFAMAALQACLTGIATRAEIVGWEELCAMCYEIADAMMKARKEPT